MAVDTEARTALVIDCPAGAVRTVIRSLKEQGIEIVDILITHWDCDHYAGAVQLAKAWPARRLFYNLDTAAPVNEQTNLRRTAAFRSLVEESLLQTDLQPCLEGTTDQIGDCNWKVVAPTYRELTEAVTHNDRNHGSAVVVLAWATWTAAVGGDADGRVWKRLIDDGELGSVTVLRCAHHGGHLGGAQPVVGHAEILAALQPESLVVSVGTSNQHGHPSPALISAANAVKARILCTEATPHCGAATGAPRPCAGDIRIASIDSSVTPNVHDHLQAMKGLTPLCKVGAAASSNHPTSPWGRLR